MSGVFDRTCENPGLDSLMGDESTRVEKRHKFLWDARDGFLKITFSH